MYTDEEILCSLTEVRERAEARREWLNYLLTTEYPPEDIYELISKERQAIADLDSLIYEEQVKAAHTALKQLALCEFSGSP